MPRASPGAIAWGALRRKNLREISAPACNADRQKAAHPSTLVKEAYILTDERWLYKRRYFTLDLSGIGVGCGRLGEVESLDGDCRPPPPGNPRRPSRAAKRICRNVKLSRNLASIGAGRHAYYQRFHHSGGFFLPIRKYRTLNKKQKIANLKKLIHQEYFKNNCSYFSCTEKFSMLEFDRFHYHLYGDWLVKPPPIAITNVLEIQD